MNLGKAISVLKSMKQDDLAAVAGISKSYLSLLERNKRDPNFSTVCRLACALNLSLMVLIILASESMDELTKANPNLAKEVSLLALGQIVEQIPVD